MVVSRAAKNAGPTIGGSAGLPEARADRVTGRAILRDDRTGTLLGGRRGRHPYREFLRPLNLDPQFDALRRDDARRSGTTTEQFSQRTRFHDFRFAAGRSSSEHGPNRTGIHHPLCAQIALRAHDELLNGGRHGVARYRGLVVVRDREQTSTERGKHRRLREDNDLIYAERFGGGDTKQASSATVGEQPPIRSARQFRRVGRPGAHPSGNCSVDCVQRFEGLLLCRATVVRPKKSLNGFLRSLSAKDSPSAEEIIRIDVAQNQPDIRGCRVAAAEPKAGRPR